MLITSLSTVFPIIDMYDFVAWQQSFIAFPKILIILFLYILH